MVLVALGEKIIDGYFAMVPRKKPEAANIEQARVIAHRGAHHNEAGILENTHAAFSLAQKVGCWGIELDVHATADNVLVVNHDPTLHRLWGHDAAIAQLSFPQLRTLEPEIPTLAEVITTYRGMHFFIELKAPFQQEQALVDTLQDLSPGKDYHLLSLDAAVFQALVHFPKHALLLVAVHNNVNEFCALSIQKEYGGVLGSYLLLTDKKIQQLKEAKQLSGVGFVNSKNSLYRELNRGIHWLFTNQAQAVSQYLMQLK